MTQFSRAANWCSPRRQGPARNLWPTRESHDWLCPEKNSGDGQWNNYPTASQPLHRPLLSRPAKGVKISLPRAHHKCDKVDKEPCAWGVDEFSPRFPRFFHPGRLPILGLNPMGGEAEPMGKSEAAATGRTCGARFHPTSTGNAGSKPVWWSAALAPPAADPLRLTEDGNARELVLGEPRGDVGERRCFPMTRFARVFAVLAALATVLLVSGASTKY